MLTHTHNIKVRYAETDAMQRAHHSNFLIWFEAARIDLLDQIGLPYQEIESKGYYIPVLSAQVEYLKPVSFNDQLSIQVMLKEKPKVRFSFQYQISLNNELIAKGSTEHVFINKQNNVTRIPDFFTEKIAHCWD
jgi:acyl-CoA thioester hydrolase